MSKANDVIEIYKQLSEENQRKFTNLLNLAVKAETSHTAQAVSSSHQAMNQ